MTIDEYIAREREKAKEQRSHIDTWDEEYSKKCEECAEEHEQLAEWVEELKMYKSLSPRELVSEKQRSDRDIEYHKGFNNGHNKALDDFAERLTKYLGVENATKYGNKNAEQQRNSYDTLMKYEIADAIDDISEQLKAGDNNAD